MDTGTYEAARIKWILRQREIFKAQLTLLEGGPSNPYDGASVYLLFVDTRHARDALAGWIKEIDTELGLDNADRT